MLALVWRARTEAIVRSPHNGVFVCNVISIPASLMYFLVIHETCVLKVFSLHEDEVYTLGVLLRVWEQDYTSFCSGRVVLLHVSLGT